MTFIHSSILFSVVFLPIIMLISSRLIQRSETPGSRWWSRWNWWSPSLPLRDTHCTTDPATRSSASLWLLLLGQRFASDRLQSLHCEFAQRSNTHRLSKHIGVRHVQALRGAPLEELKSGSYHILNSAKRSTGGGRKFGDHINLVLKPLETLGNLWIPSETLTLAEDPTVSLPWKAHTGHRSATKATPLFNCCMMLNAKCHTRICCLHFTTQSPMVSCSKTPPILRQVARRFDSWNGRIGAPWWLFATMSWKCIASSWGPGWHGMTMPTTR